eukprot:scaffold33617_cov129-Skeletonema_dohrnii-CCMP3373.AAC.1
MVPQIKITSLPVIGTADVNHIMNIGSIASTTERLPLSMQWSSAVFQQDDYDVFVKKTSSRCSGHAGVAAGETKVLRSDGDGCYAAWYAEAE